MENLNEFKPSLHSENKTELDFLSDRAYIQDYKNLFMLLEQRDKKLANSLKADFEEFEKTFYEMSVESEATKVRFSISDLLEKIPENKWIKFINEYSVEPDWHAIGH